MTPRQLEVLKQLSQEGNFAHYMPYMGRFNQNPYYFMHGIGGKVTREIKALYKAGLVDIKSDDAFGTNTRAVINEKGRSALK